MLWPAAWMVMESCAYFNRQGETDRVAVARVYDKFLYKEDIEAIVPPSTPPDDSALLVKNYMDNWIRQNVVLHKAENNLASEAKNVQKQLDEYRNSLITYIYESELIRQRLDTVVTEEEIAQYYKDNPRNFELKDNIIQVLYLKVKKNAPKLDKVRQWYKSNNAKDRLLLEEYARQFAGDFNLDDETWLLFDDLLKKVPIRTYDKEQFLRNNRFIETADSSEIYFINIKGFKIKESLSPLSFERDNIRAIILNKRKLKLVQDMEKAAIQEAMDKNECEIFANPAP